MEPTLITHPDSDARNPMFWRHLVSSDPESKVAKETAVFAIRTLLAQLMGYKGHRMQIDFDSDPITVEELFSRLEKLCGGDARRDLCGGHPAMGVPTAKETRTGRR